MPAIEVLLPSTLSKDSSPPDNPLPELLQTPSGLAILEIQGTIHGPFQSQIPDLENETQSPSTIHHIGRLEFPLYDPSAGEDDGKWMKKVYLYVGKYQRLTGEVKKLAKPLGVLRKVGTKIDAAERNGSAEEEALEIVEIVKFKLLFSGRPEPVGK